MAKQKGEAFKDWVGKAGKRPPAAAAWKAWPPAVFEEIQQVLGMNDRGEATVTLRAMLARLRDAHGVHATRSHFDAYMRYLGRTSWTLK